MEVNGAYLSKWMVKRQIQLIHIQAIIKTNCHKASCQTCDISRKENHFAAYKNANDYFMIFSEDASNSFG